jgi:hypothetical protein
MAKQMKKAAPPAARRGGSRWMQGMVFGALVTMATPTALLGGVLLLPSILVWFFDESEGRGTLRPVLLFGFAGSVQPMLTLWGGGHTIDGSLELLSNMTVTVLAWSLQGAGWLLAQGIPFMIRMALEGQARVEILSLRSQREKIAEEWGIPPEGDENLSG